MSKASGIFLIAVGVGVAAYAMPFHNEKGEAPTQEISAGQVVKTQVATPVTSMAMTTPKALPEIEPSDSKAGRQTDARVGRAQKRHARQIGRRCHPAARRRETRGCTIEDPADEHSWRSGQPDAGASERASARGLLRRRDQWQLDARFAPRHEDVHRSRQRQSADGSAGLHTPQAGTEQPGAGLRRRMPLWPEHFGQRRSLSAGCRACSGSQAGPAGFAGDIRQIQF